MSTEATDTAELAALKQAFDRERDAKHEALLVGSDWRRKYEQAEAENNDLRDQLHGMTIEKARLEGYIDRAREFDPKPEPTMVPLDQHSAYGGRNYVDSYGSAMSPGPAPWYRRR